MTEAQAKKAVAEAEAAYDAAVTKLQRCHKQLSAKADKAAKLSPDAYRKWLADKKEELSQLQEYLQAKKSARAEARRTFNGWRPARREGWLPWPDEEGWWWHYCSEDGLSVHEFVEIGGVITAVDADALERTGDGPPGPDQCWHWAEVPEEFPE